MCKVVGRSNVSEKRALESIVFLCLLISFYELYLSYQPKNL